MAGTNWKGGGGTPLPPLRTGANTAGAKCATAQTAAATGYIGPTPSELIVVCAH